jgi:hypothetical protein
VDPVSAADPAVPELARVELDAVRERLAEVRGSRGRVSPPGFDPTAPAPGEPTGHVVVQHARDIPESIAGHAMYHHGPGVMRHARLGIFVIVLDEIDPEKRGRQALQALGDLGLVRERLAKVERERDQLRDELVGKRAIVEDLQHQRDHARAEIESLRATVTAVQAERDAVHTQARAEIERLTAKVGERGKRLGERCKELDAARADAERLRGLLAEALDGWQTDASTAGCACHDLECSCTWEPIERVRREAGLT